MNSLETFIANCHEQYSMKINAERRKKEEKEKRANDYQDAQIKKLTARAIELMPQELSACIQFAYSSWLPSIVNNLRSRDDAQEGDVHQAAFKLCLPDHAPIHFSIRAVQNGESKSLEWSIDGGFEVSNVSYSPSFDFDDDDELEASKPPTHRFENRSGEYEQLYVAIAKAREVFLMKEKRDIEAAEQWLKQQEAKKAFEERQKAQAAAMPQPVKTEPKVSAHEALLLTCLKDLVGGIVEEILEESRREQY
ncbi:MAG TPA: hypothetical protein VEF04_09230 [Blastocatellia bacterium]|nr:hypothetical protein [Blastocatellia bacterium]